MRERHPGRCQFIRPQEAVGCGVALGIAARCDAAPGVAAGYSIAWRAEAGCSAKLGVATGCGAGPGAAAGNKAALEAATHGVVSHGKEGGAGNGGRQEGQISWERPGWPHKHTKIPGGRVRDGVPMLSSFIGTDEGD